VLPPTYIDCVVAIGHTETRVNGTSTWVTEASGVFYGYLVANDPDPAKRMYEVYLVTNRHVVASHQTVSVRLNPKKTSDQGEVFDTPIADWFTHKDPNVDVAGVRINWSVLQAKGIEVDFLTSDNNAADTTKMRDIGVSAGDAIFVIGFPMNLAGQQRNYAIVRPGAIARISDLLESASTFLLIDSHVFPGNSGGPVILEPSLMSIQGTKPIDKAYFLGIVNSYIPYIDVAVSPQTQRARVTFEENSGLAEVVPVDRINEAIKTWRDSLPVSTPPVPLKVVPVKP
jgi:hypothetical protein